MGRAGLRMGAMGVGVVLMALPLAGSEAAIPAPPVAARRGCSAVPSSRRIPAHGVTVVVGASIAEGYRSTGGERTAWPHLLATRLRRNRVPVSIVNSSVNAARLLTDSPGQPCTSALHREGPALAVRGVRTLVLTDLINDIQQPPDAPDPDVIIAGLKRFVARARAHRVRVVAVTIAPYGGFVRYGAAGEQTRREVNDFIRHGGEFSGVLDFDAVVRDPYDPTRMRPAYDSGDHLHPNDAGQRAMSRAVPFALLQLPALRGHLAAPPAGP